MDTLATWTERLAAYIRQSGPVPTACIVPRVLTGKHGRRYRWQAVRGSISLSPQGPTYAEREPAAPIRQSHLRAQRDLESLVDQERRIVFHGIPGKLNNDEAELALALLSDLTGRRDLWP